MKYYDFKTFEEMYAWLLDNSIKETELFVKISRQKPEKCIDNLRLSGFSQKCPVVSAIFFKARCKLQF